METSSPNPGARPGRGVRAAARPPLAVRRRLERQAARQRIAAHARKRLTAAQRAHDPLARAPSLGRRLGKVLLSFLGSSAVHAGVVALGFVLGSMHIGRREHIRQEVTIEVRERKPEPPPPPPPPPPEPPKPEQIEKPVRPPPKMAKAPPPPPAEAPKGPPPRVVGLSLESTSEGGGGPAFAVGQTRMGQTAERAEEPKPLPQAEAPPVPSPEKTNRVASRIPVDGVTILPPKRKQNREPPYPEALKAQSIEADVSVMVVVGTDGKVTKVTVLKGSPYAEFNEIAKQFALDEEYEPATRDGVPFPYPLSYLIRFRLKDE
jgi:protein TonB